MADQHDVQAEQFNLNDQIFLTEDPVLSGRDVLSIGGFTPVTAFSLIKISEGGTQAIGLDETIDLRKSGAVSLKSFEGDRLFRCLLDEREIVWGANTISAPELRAIGGVSEDQELVLDSNRDRPIEDDGVVKLSRDGVERIRSRERSNREVTIVLNGEQKEVSVGQISFTELAKLAFPNLVGRPQVCFTMSFANGPRRRPEGSLEEGDKVRVVERMVFNVSATDKS